MKASRPSRTSSSAPSSPISRRPYRNTVEEIIADGDRVVVLARGEVKTVRGEDYNNSYCFVIWMQGGKIVELCEYMDTALAEPVLEMD